MKHMDKLLIVPMGNQANPMPIIGSIAVYQAKDQLLLCFKVHYHVLVLS